MSVQNFVRVPAILLPTNQSVVAMHVTVNPVAYVAARPPTGTSPQKPTKVPKFSPPTQPQSAKIGTQPQQTSSKTDLVMPTNTTTITVSLDSIEVTQATTQKPPTQTEVPPAANSSAPTNTDPPTVRVKMEKIDSERVADVLDAGSANKTTKTYSKLDQQAEKANEEDDEVMIVKVIDSPIKTDDLIRDAVREATKLMAKGRSAEEAMDISIEPLRPHFRKICKEAIREVEKNTLGPKDEKKIESVAGPSKQTDFGSHTSSPSTPVPLQSNRPISEVIIGKKQRLEEKVEDKSANGEDNDEELPIHELMKNAVKSTSIKTDGIYYDERKRRFAYSQRLKTILEEGPQVVSHRKPYVEVPLKHRFSRPLCEDRNKPALPDILKSHRMKSLVTWPLPAKSFELNDEAFDGRQAKTAAKRKISLHYGTVYVDEIFKMAPKKRCEETKEYFDFFAQCRACDPPTKYLRVEDYLKHHKAKHPSESHLFKMRQESNKTFCASL